MMKRAYFIAVTIFSLLGAGMMRDAYGWTFLPTAKSRAEGSFRQADKLLARADSLYEGGNPGQALPFYKRALARFEKLQEETPELHEGMPQYRVVYCQTQIASITGKLQDSGLLAVEAAKEVVEESPAAPSRAASEDPPERVPATEETSEPEPESGPDAELIAADLQRARKLLDSGQAGSASRLLVAVVKEDPANPVARFLLALARVQQSRYDEALAAVEDLEGRNESLPLLLLLAAAHCGQESYFDAMLLLDRAITLAPKDPRAYYNLAWLQLAQGQGTEAFRNAEAYYRQAIRLGGKRDKAIELKLGLE